MGKGSYEQTTSKHPTKDLVVAKKTTRLRLSSDTALPIESGQHAKVSKPYVSTQSGQKVVLFAPTGNHSKFVLPVSTLNAVYKKVSSNSPETVSDLRDEEGDKPNVQTGGRGTNQEIQARGTGKKNKKFVSNKNQEGESMNNPKNIAAGDQYDLENLLSIVEEISTYDDQQLDAFMEQLDDQQIELIESVIEYLKEANISALTAARHIKHMHDVASRGDDLTAEQERDVRAAMEAQPRVAARFAARRLGMSQTEMETQDQDREAELAKRGDTNATLSRMAVKGVQLTEPGKKNKTDETDESQLPDREANQGATTVKDKNAGKGKGKGKGKGGGGFAALTQAVQDVKIPKSAGPELKKIANMVKSSYENDQPQIVENVFVNSAIDGNILNFSNTVRDALDYYAHSAIENMKNEVLQDDSTSHMNQNDESILESIEMCNEQQLDQLFETLDEQQAEYIYSLVEAKYGTKKGRKRLAKKIQAGKDIGKKGKGSEMDAKEATKHYDQVGKRVAAAANKAWKKYGGKK